MSVIDSLDHAIAQQETTLRTEQELLEMLKEARLKAMGIIGNGDGTPANSAREKVAPALALVAPKAGAKPMTNVDAMIGVLSAIGGGPLHVDEIIEQSKAQFGIEIDKKVAASTLRKKATKGRVFKAHGGNRFSLLDKSVVGKATA